MFLFNVTTIKNISFVMGGEVGCNLGRVVVYGGQERIINAEKECFLLLNNTEQRSVVVTTFLLGTR